MGIFGDILNKIKGAGAPKAQVAAPTAKPAAPTAAPAAPASAPAKPLWNVDVDAVLALMAKNKGGGGNYKVSIVDLLKLLDLDSSLAARKKLAEELNVHAGEHGSAEQNIALHKAVLAKIAENGGTFPTKL